MSEKKKSHFYQQKKKQIVTFFSKIVFHNFLSVLKAKDVFFVNIVVGVSQSATK